MTDDPGESLYDAIVGEYDLTAAELVVLREAQRTADLCDDLQAVAEAEALMVMGPAGPKVHPAVVELRQQRLALARLVASLRIPTDDDGEMTGEERTQRRGVRGVYGFGGAA